jgi:hypothetical protein
VVPDNDFLENIVRGPMDMDVHDKKRNLVTCTVTTSDGRPPATSGKGDFVTTFPLGMSCTLEAAAEAVQKHIVFY